MSVASVIRAIRSLPYQDMMLVANELRDRIGELTHNKIEAVTLAEILVRLQTDQQPLSEQTREEEKILVEIFNRKRSVNISQRGTGWVIEIPTLDGSQVLGTELRPMFPMMLDQIITMHVLGKDE